jgi:hypothetical protein
VVQTNCTNPRLQWADRNLPNSPLIRVSDKIYSAEYEIKKGMLPCGANPKLSIICGSDTCRLENPGVTIVSCPCPCEPLEETDINLTCRAMSSGALFMIATATIRCESEVKIDASISISGGNVSQTADFDPISGSLFVMEECVSGSYTIQVIISNPSCIADTISKNVVINCEGSSCVVQEGGDPGDDIDDDDDDDKGGGKVDDKKPREPVVEVCPTCGFCGGEWWCCIFCVLAIIAIFALTVSLIAVILNPGNPLAWGIFIASLIALIGSLLGLGFLCNANFCCVYWELFYLAALFIIAALIYLFCNPTSGIGWGVLLFAIGFLIFSIWALTKYCEFNFCTMWQLLATALATDIAAICLVDFLPCVSWFCKPEKDIIPGFRNSFWIVVISGIIVVLLGLFCK